MKRKIALGLLMVAIIACGISITSYSLANYGTNDNGADVPIQAPMTDAIRERVNENLYAILDEKEVESFPAFVVRDDVVTFGIGYTDYTGFSDEEDKVFFSSGFITLDDYVPADGTYEIHRLDEDAVEGYGFLLNSEMTTNGHFVCDGCYVKYGLYPEPSVTCTPLPDQKDEEAFSDALRSVSDVSLGSIYSYDSDSLVYNADLGDEYVPVSGISLVDEIDYGAIEKEFRRLLISQDYNFMEFDYSSAIYFGIEALNAYLLSCQEEKFMGCSVDQILEDLKKVDPMDGAYITPEGLMVVPLELQPPVEPSGWAKFLSGLVTVVAIVATVAICIVNPAMAVAGFLIGAAVECCVDLITGNELDPLRIVTAGVTGVLCAGVGIVSGAIIGGLGELVIGVNEGLGDEEILSRVLIGTAAGLVLGVGMHYVASAIHIPHPGTPAAIKKVIPPNMKPLKDPLPAAARYQAKNVVTDSLGKTHMNRNASISPDNTTRLEKARTNGPDVGDRTLTEQWKRIDRAIHNEKAVDTLPVETSKPQRILVEAPKSIRERFGINGLYYYKDGNNMWLSLREHTMVLKNRHLFAELENPSSYRISKQKGFTKNVNAPKGYDPVYMVDNDPTVLTENARASVAEKFSPYPKKSNDIWLVEKGRASNYNQAKAGMAHDIGWTQADFSDFLDVCGKTGLEKTYSFDRKTFVNNLMDRYGISKGEMDDILSKARTREELNRLGLGSDELEMLQHICGNPSNKPSIKKIIPREDFMAALSDRYGIPYQELMNVSDQKWTIHETFTAMPDGSLKAVAELVPLDLHDAINHKGLVAFIDHASGTPSFTYHENGNLVEIFDYTGVESMNKQGLAGRAIEYRNDKTIMTDYLINEGGNPTTVAFKDGRVVKYDSYESYVKEMEDALDNMESFAAPSVNGGATAA